jgi:hypothetical protein
LRGLLADVTDASGHAMTPADLAAPPVLRVMFMPDSGASAVDVTSDVVWRKTGPEFGFSRSGHWFAWLLPWRMKDYGTYMATLESGDPTAYKVDPTCADWTMIQRPKPPRVPPHNDKDRRGGRGH